MRLRRTTSCEFVGSGSDVFFWIVIMRGMMWRFIMRRRGYCDFGDADGEYGVLVVV